MVASPSSVWDPIARRLTIWPDGTVPIAGRACDLINSGGVKIAPEGIERVFAALLGAQYERANTNIAPEVIVQVDALPRNRDAKIDRERLLGLARAFDAGRS